MRKTTKREFDIFKQEFTRVFELLGLVRYDVLFSHKKEDESNYASIEVDETNKIACANLNLYIKDENVSGYNPKAHGRHEAIHLFLWRLTWIGSQRYARKEELVEEEEGIIKLLTKLL